MPTTELNRGKSIQLEYAQNFFRPDNMGFIPHNLGWEKDIPGVGPVVFMSLGSEHARVTTSLNETTEGTVFDLLSQMEQETFEMTDRASMPPNHLENVRDAGGSVIVAFRKNSDNLNHKSWVAFGIVQGNNGQKALSEFIGIRKDCHGKGIAVELRCIQMYYALQEGKHAFELEMGPLRGRMANLSIRKLGGIVEEFVPTKYPGMDYGLYGPDTEDRIKVVYNLLDPKVQKKMRDLALRSEPDSTEFSVDITQIPIVTSKNIKEVLLTNSDHILYEIPDDADTLDPTIKHTWRNDMVQVFESLLTHKKIYKQNDNLTDVTKIDTEIIYGDYAITNFIRLDGKNFYIFTRKDSIEPTNI